MRVARSSTRASAALVLLASIAFAALAASPGAARADENTAARRAAAARELDRPHTSFEINAGFLMLPGAQVCPISIDPATCKRGEFSLAVGVHNMYRFHAWAFGGGIEWATTLRSDAAAGDATLQREHSRRYFLYEAQVRYYFITTRSWDWWAGATVGGVVVNDSWSVVADRNPYTDTDFVGPRAATLGTEGFAAGASIGVEWAFASNWSLGPSLRYASWFLPSARKVSPTKDVASLSGRLDMFDVGVRLAYRIAL